MTLKDTGAASIDNWVLTWTAPAGVQVANGWNATVSQAGQTVTAVAPAWAPNLAPGASWGVGMTANGSSGAAPTNFHVGSAACTAG